MELGRPDEHPGRGISPRLGNGSYFYYRYYFSARNPPPLGCAALPAHEYVCVVARDKHSPLWVVVTGLALQILAVLFISFRSRGSALLIFRIRTRVLQALRNV